MSIQPSVVLAQPSHGAHSVKPANDYNSEENFLYFIDRSSLNYSYDVFMSAVVVASSANDARYIHPTFGPLEISNIVWNKSKDNWVYRHKSELVADSGWTSPESVIAIPIGRTSLPIGMCVLADFKSG